ncbi:hypothetical protein GCM10023142_36480 [Anaerocolumna aminovalerica]
MSIKIFGITVLSEVLLDCKVIVFIFIPSLSMQNTYYKSSAINMLINICYNDYIT